MSNTVFDVRKEEWEAVSVVRVHQGERVMSFTLDPQLIS